MHPRTYATRRTQRNVRLVVGTAKVKRDEVAELVPRFPLSIWWTHSRVKESIKGSAFLPAVSRRFLLGFTIWNFAVSSLRIGDLGGDATESKHITSPIRQ